MSEIENIPIVEITKKVKSIKPAETLKLLFSSMFARRMKYLVVGCTEDKQDETLWFQTNVTPDLLQVYRPDDEHVCHAITFKSDEMKKAVEALFPVFANTIFILELSKFLKVFNKTPQSNLIVENNILYFGEEKEECGAVISMFHIECYKHFYDVYDKEKAIATFNIDDSKIARSEVSYQTILDHPVDSLTEAIPFQLPLYEGFNVISSEYLKKHVIPHKLTVYVWLEVKAVRLLIEYDDVEIQVRSIQPGLYFFPRLS